MLRGLFAPPRCSIAARKRGIAPKLLGRLAGATRKLCFGYDKANATVRRPLLPALTPLLQARTGVPPRLLLPDAAADAVHACAAPVFAQTAGVRAPPLPSPTRSAQ
jgi:hypothetical protein